MRKLQMKRFIAVSLGLIAIALAPLRGPLQAQTPVAEAYAGWPVSWVKAYERFESYCATRRAKWPSSDLQIDPDGRITHGLQIVETRTEDLSLDLFLAGRIVRGMAVRKNLATLQSDSLPRGRYAACMKSTGFLGYQYHYPLIWFEIPKRPASGPNHGDSSRNQITAMPAPGEPDAVWPNERLLLFLDFHVFPQHHPGWIREKNSKVSPAVMLRVDNHGVIFRDSVLDQPAEQALRWRIYFNGVRVENGPAAHVRRLDLARGVGTYQAFVGVEGPNGFMPVSNLVEVPLFPDRSGRHVVEPPDSNEDGIPDFIERMEQGAAAERAKKHLPAEAPGSEKQSPGERRANAGYSARTEDQAVVALWHSWRFDLEMRKADAAQRQ